ncbi:sigma-70 family RNA polymerase sigma factor [Arcticibacterium luteifluviistationis]|uniref:Sigma-70 family RNA polymerase sigma factor n=1 Tax=Arcticibacterium luteifluviistationis TaxID=1784714 RepID=A0A2Z4G8R6_9BACT|nr:sigma-70 family RNA polymerase sigma factor [Arcticibacterium luteifluviistationis]AWV97460.1 sigma-70 family RNA polymerase sigma factor [Arcticibacterium luteifluviistationis]
MNSLKDYESKKEFDVFVASTFSDLMKYKQENEQAAFNELLLKDLYEVKRYIVKRVSTALMKGNLPQGKYKVDDFIDQLFIEVYDHIEEVKNEKGFYLWLFKKANDLLDDSIEEEKFDESFLENIDDYTKPEWDEMQENFSTDGGGDLLMIEELDDMSYNHNDYTLNHVFIEDEEKGWIEKIDKDLKTEDIQNQIGMVLYYLPFETRTIFQLYTVQHLGLDDIAQIRNHTLEDVKQFLKDAKKALQSSFINRYPTR